ncbi:MAG: hypothetical protein PVF58_16715 [Candidatus Methanofastidiosia archaeon]|jgi:hypothetical protein
MISKKGFVSIAVIGILLALGSRSQSKTPSPLWHFKIEGMTHISMSPNGEYIIVACETEQLCGDGQYYVFDRYGNTITHDCIEGEITGVDVANNGAFSIGTPFGFKFSAKSYDIYENLDMKSPVESISVSGDGSTTVVGTRNEILIVDIFDMVDKKYTGEPINFTAISTNGEAVVAGTNDTIFLYCKSKRKWEDYSTDATITALAVSDNGSTIACGMTNKRVLILDPFLERQRTIGMREGIKNIAITADGSNFVCGDRSGLVYYYMVILLK